MKPTLLILAAGLGSRYGGLKQIEAMGPSGEALLEYSVHDAVAAGFGKVVFVIRRDFLNDFRERILRRFHGRIPVDYVFQDLTALPTGFQPVAERARPWGTGHAVLIARPVISEPFAVINADDYYGADAFAHLHEFLSRPAHSWPPVFCLVAYELAKTLSEHGAVSRGICEVDRKGFLQSVTERTQVEIAETGPCYYDAVRHAYPMPPDAPTSMNCFGFRPEIFDFLESQFRDFLDASGTDPRAEFYLPAAVGTMIHRNQAKVRVLRTSETWMGVTHPADRDDVVERLRALVKQDRYPQALWND
ncbi:MAG: nucleotidyltransferase [Opitutales bacterium]|nr:nucleotidyltransferase [Opitutales bacterium]